MQKTEQIVEMTGDRICPWCGWTLEAARGNTYSGYEGNFESCFNCGAVFCKITVGSQFTIGDPLKACTVYEVVEIKDHNLITCTEIAKVRASVLDKPNKNYYTYLSREHIVSTMAGHLREGLL